MNVMTQTRGPAQVAPALRRIVYRSSAVRPVKPSELETLVAQACSRNRAADVGGVLVQDGDAFLQVLEGPGAALDRLVASIRRDRRHTAVDLISDHGVARRAFAGWDMQLAVRGSAPVTAPAIHPREPLMQALGGAPERLPELLAEMVRASIPVGMRPWSPEADADLRAGALLRLLIDCRGTPEVGRMDSSLLESAPDYRAFVCLIEDVSVALGALWQRDGCDGTTVALALAALQGAVRRRATPGGPGMNCIGRALVATAPGEPHVLGALLKAEMLRASGWEVEKAFAIAGDPIEERLCADGYRVLVLASSRIRARADRAEALAGTIARARRAVPGLTVVVGGGATLGRAGDFGADAACPSAAAIHDVLKAIPGLRA